MSYLTVERQAASSSEKIEGDQKNNEDLEVRIVRSILIISYLVIQRTRQLIKLQ